MNNHQIESLEGRTLLAGHGLNVEVIGETAGAVASATARAPKISVTQRSMYFNAVQGKTDTQILRITNEGTANLDLVPGSVQILGGYRKNFSINFPSTGVSIKPGRRLDIAITFDSKPGAVVVNTARLTIVTNDKVIPSVTVGLRGLPTLGEGTNLEPSLQRVIDTFGLPINVGDASPDEYQLGTPTSDSDEVRVQALQKAGTGPVAIRPLAMFGVRSGPAVRLGYYTPGQVDSTQELWYVPSESAQSVNPIVYGQTLIDPGNAPFALYTEWPGFYNTNGTARNVYSEDGLNAIWETTSNTRKMRFYPFVDQFGNAAPNTYLVAVEEYTLNYDNQDLLFIITNVKPAESKPTLAAQALFQQPDNQRLVFNKVEIPDTNYANTTRLNQTVRVRNTGTEDLIVNFAKTGNFNISSGGGTNVTIAPGTSRNLVITFTASSGSVHNGTFTITSNDPANPSVTYDLVGFWQQYSEFLPSNHGITQEPTSKVIVNDIFGYTTVLTNTGQQLSTNGQVRTTGDEILSPYWVAADDNSYVRVTQLASFHGQTYEDENTGEIFPTMSFIGWYKQGTPGTTTTITTHAPGDGQTLLPRERNNTSAITSGGFDPKGSTFGFIVEGKEYSDPTLNPDSLSRPGYGHFVRFWPAYDKEGKLIPNSYIMLHDYNRDFTNYDFNDNIYLIENMKPVDAIKTPLTVFTEDTSKGARISFTGPATGPKILGFNVYRSATARGGYQLLNDTLLARRPVTTFIDDTVTASETYYYQIVSVGANGKESQPVTVRV